jgi:tetratricopeptide (TPR) repeat protein
MVQMGLLDQEALTCRNLKEPGRRGAGWLFRLTSRWLFFLLLLMVLCWGGTALGQEAKGEPGVAASPYLNELQVKREENWLRREIRKFRAYHHLDRAYKLMEAERLQEARIELEKYLKIDPQDLKARFSYLLVLYKLKNYQETIRQADAILGKAPKFVPALIYRGLARQSLGMAEEARQDFQAAAGIPGIQAEDRVFALNMALDVAISLKNFAAAQKALDELAKEKRDFNFYFRQGLTLEALGRLPEAEAAYQQALQAAAPLDRVRAARALGEVAKKRQNWDAAQQHFLTALAAEPRNPELLRALGELDYARKDYAASARWLRELLAVKPEARDREFLVNVLEAGQDYRGVIEEVQKLLPQAQDPEERRRFYRSLGFAYSKLGDHGRAAQAFQEAASIKEELASLEALVHSLEQAGRLEEASQQLRELLKRRPDAATLLKLGLLLERQRKSDEALHHLRAAAAGPLPRELKVLALKQAGHIHYRLGRYAEARQSFEAAASLAPRDPAVLQSLAEAEIKLGRMKEALELQKKAAQLRKEVRPPGALLESLGFLSLGEGRHQEAADYLEQAIAAGRDSAVIRENLGLVYYKLQKWNKALEHLQQALKYRRTPRTLVYLGHVYKELNKTGMAIHYMVQALPDADRLEKGERRDLFNALGYLYAEEKDYARAQEMLSRSLALQYDPVIALRLAKAQRRMGLMADARDTLEKIDPASLSAPHQADRLDELTEVMIAQGQWDTALQTALQAQALEAAPEREFRIGLIYNQLKKYPKALPNLERAVAANPDNNNYQAALGYTYYGLKRYGEAARTWEVVVKRDPNYLQLYEELGYAHMKDLNNDQAVEWFKKAIDNQPLHPVRNPEEAEQLRQAMYRFRKEVSKITNRFDFTAYLSFQTARRQQAAVAPGVLGAGAVPSQGGVELAYQPPVIGFRDERVFQAFSRILWNIHPRSMRFDEDSFQGGAGLRYKPLKTQNLWLWGERLFKIGDNGIDDWLLRILYSWNYGYDLKPGKSRWNYTYLYLDWAYFTKSPGTWAYYGELRQGITFNFDDTWLITPHAVLDFRYQDPLVSGTSYLEEGVGVSFKYLFWQSKYEVHRCSFEILAYYKHGNFLKRTLGVTGDKYDGFFMTGIFGF